ncbi:MAG: DUF2284 domain-containing protein [Eubacterium sp.]
MEEKLIEYLKKHDYFEVMPIRTEQIKITEDVRKACEDNLCGHYGKNYMCPPSVGNLEHYREVIGSYEKGLLFSKVYPLKNRMDYNNMVLYGANFRKDSQTVQREIREMNLDCLFFSAGTCSICKKCAILTEEPCRFPNDTIPSLEASGIDVVRLTMDVGLKYNNGADTVTYIGLMLYKD